MCIQLLRGAGRRLQERNRRKRRGKCLLILVIHNLDRHASVLHSEDGLAPFDRFGSILENPPRLVASTLDGVSGKSTQRRVSFGLLATGSACRVGASAPRPEEGLNPRILEHVGILKSLIPGLVLRRFGSFQRAEIAWRRQRGKFIRRKNRRRRPASPIRERRWRAGANRSGRRNVSFARLCRHRRSQARFNAKLCQPRIPSWSGHRKRAVPRRETGDPACYLVGAGGIGALRLVRRLKS